VRIKQIKLYFTTKYDVLKLQSRKPDIVIKGTKWTLEGESRRVLLGTEHVHKSLAHKQPDSDTNGDSDHGSTNVYAIALCCNTSGGGETGLEECVSNLI
jgi:hypothetical protein